MHRRGKNIHRSVPRVQQPGSIRGSVNEVYLVDAGRGYQRLQLMLRVVEECAELRSVLDDTRKDVS